MTGAAQRPKRAGNTCPWAWPSGGSRVSSKQPFRQEVAGTVSLLRDQSSWRRKGSIIEEGLPGWAGRLRGREQETALPLPGGAVQAPHWFCSASRLCNNPACRWDRPTETGQEKPHQAGTQILQRGQDFPPWRGEQSGRHPRATQDPSTSTRALWGCKLFWRVERSPKTKHCTRCPGKTAAQCPRGPVLVHSTAVPILTVKPRCTYQGRSMEARQGVTELQPA